MAIVDHGFWVKYIPLQHPEDAPRGAAFCRRESDGHDWYEYVNVDAARMNDVHKGRKKQFAPATVKCVVEMPDTPKGRSKEDAIIRVAAVDETRLFPQDCQLIELTDVERPQDEDALIEEFANRRIDLKSGKIGERWQPPAPVDKITPVLEAILARLDRLESKL